VYRREWSIGVGGTRIDVAAINGQITGCEIKSCRDNFGRLRTQIALYNGVLDEAVLVVEGSAAATRAELILPDWWGIWLASEAAAGVRLQVLRDVHPNPAPDPAAIAQLLWRDEAYAVLHQAGRSEGLRNATRWRLWEALARELPLDQLQRQVRDTIKARPGW